MTAAAVPAVAARAVFPASLWADVTPLGREWPVLQTSLSTDVTVIGAGFTGLAAALELRRRGATVAVVEAMEPGWGASGRNNGQVIPTLSRPDPDDIVASHGETGERFVALLRDSAADLFDLVRREGIAAEAEQTGWVQPAHSPGRMRIAERRVGQWTRRGGDVELLTRDQVAAKLGTSAWHGGWWARTGGHINPLALARGLAESAARDGAQIFAGTPALAANCTRSAWVVTTPLGRVISRALILATNAYTAEIVPGLAPQIAREVVPVASWQMATAPIPEAARAAILPARTALSDMRGELHFMRLDARNRLVTGGALALPIRARPRLERMVGRRLATMFPELGKPRFEFVWNGYVGMTADFLPRVHDIGRGGVAWTGCNGRAVALSLSIGRELARTVSGVARREIPLPFSEVRPLPLHGLVRRVAPLRLIAYRRRDRREI